MNRLHLICHRSYKTDFKNPTEFWKCTCSPRWSGLVVQSQIEVAGSPVGDTRAPSVESLPEIPQQTVDRGPPTTRLTSSSPALDHPIGILYFWHQVRIDTIQHFYFESFFVRILFSAKLKPHGYYLEHFWQTDLGYIRQAIIGVKVPNSSHVASIQHRRVTLGMFLQSLL